MLRHLLSQNDLSPDEMESLFERAMAMKKAPIVQDLAGRSLVMLFEKPSTRTRLSFEIGMTQLGGHAVYLDWNSSQLSRGESLRDTTTVVSRMADLFMVRVYKHETLEEMVRWATIPVINALSDREHPCQTMADFLTMREHKGQLRGLRLTFVGDGNNNMTHSLMLGSTRLGIDMVVGCPAELQPQREFIELAEQNAAKYGGSVTITHDPVEAVSGADVIYADAWVSMGREAERDQRMGLLAPYQVNDALVRHADRDFIFLHCGPAKMGTEVTADVAYGPHSVMADEAENRLHIQKAILAFLWQASRQQRQPVGATA